MRRFGAGMAVALVFAGLAGLAGPPGAAHAVDATGAAGASTASAFSADSVPPAVPALHLSQDSARVGDWETVTGTGWNPGAGLQLEVCGIGGSSGDCDLQDVVQVTADTSGGFSRRLQVHEPPTPCPCAVHATPYTGSAASPVDAPLTIPGLRFMPEAVPQVVGTAKLLDVSVVDDSSPLTLFGGEASKKVTLTFGNLGTGSAVDPGVALTVSLNGQEKARYPLPWTPGTVLASGQKTTVVREIYLPGGWFRYFDIGVAVGKAGAPAPVVRTVSTSVQPWGELLVPLALLLGAGLIVLGRNRRRGTAPVVAAHPRRENAPVGPRNGGVLPQAVPVPPNLWGLGLAPDQEALTLWTAPVTPVTQEVPEVLEDPESVLEADSPAGAVVPESEPEGAEPATPPSGSPEPETSGPDDPERDAQGAAVTEGITGRLDVF